MGVQFKAQTAVTTHSHAGVRGSPIPQTSDFSFSPFLEEARIGHVVRVSGRRPKLAVATESARKATCFQPALSRTNEVRCLAQANA